MTSQMAAISIVMVPTSIRKDCQAVSFFSISMVSFTTLSR